MDARAFVAAGAEGFSEGIPETIVPEVHAGLSNAERLKVTVQANLLRHQVLSRMRTADVIHLPFSSAVPLSPRNKERVITIFDLQHLELPELFSPAEKLYRRFTYDIPANHTDIIITDSEFAKQSIIQRLNIPAERIVSIPLGANFENFRPESGPKQNYLLFPARA